MLTSEQSHLLPTIGGLTKEPPSHLPTRSSAVCLLFLKRHESDQDLSVLITKRSLAVRSHRGQVSFPGGRMESADKDINAAAAREMQEEVAARPESLHFLGYLAATTALDGSTVVCTVAYSTQLYEDFKANADEVAELHAIPWTVLGREHSSTFRFNVFGVWRTSLLFDVAPHLRIWGLTAKLLYMADLR